MEMETYEMDPSNEEKILSEQPPKKSSMPLIAGILLILAGLMGILTWVTVLAVDPSFIDSILATQQVSSTISAEQIFSFLRICAIVGCIFSIFAILAGVFSLRRKMWGIVVVGSILGLFTIGPAFISSILSFIGLILVVISRKEFQ